MRRNAEVGLAEVDEGGDDRDRVGRQVHQLDAVEVKKPALKSLTGMPNPCSTCARKMTVSPVPSIGNSSPAAGLKPTCALGLSSAVRQRLNLLFSHRDVSQTVLGSGIATFSILPSS
jgi:hypothetical protein